MRRRDYKSLILLLMWSITGSDGALVVIPTGPSVITAFVGANVTLGISFSGVSDPVISWIMGTLTVATWSVTHSAPDIAPLYRGGLSVEQSGSLFLQNIQLQNNGTYTVQLAKSGVNQVSSTFTLLVYDNITDVLLNVAAQDPVEGVSGFTLSYTYLRGPAEVTKWYFKGVELANSTRYSITPQALIINQLSRNDTGLYSVELRNQLSTVTQNRTLVVLYGPEQPILEVSPTKAAFMAGESISLSCRGQGEPVPTALWTYKGQSLPTLSNGSVYLANIQTSQSGVYSCNLLNHRTNTKLVRNVSVEVRGLSATAVTAIAAGVPCGILLLLLIALFIFLCYSCYKKKNRKPKYPVARAVAKAVMSQSGLTQPHQLLSTGFKQPPDYNLHQQKVLSERLGSLPVAMPPVRVATTV